MSQIETCPERVPEHAGYGFRTCGRPIKRNGKCGIHARADETHAANSLKFEAEWKARKEAGERVKALGIPGVRLSSETNGTWDGRVSLPLEDLERLVAGDK